jgi:hypothetical protein
MELSIIEYFGMLTFMSIVFSLIWQMYQKRIILSGYTDKFQERMWHRRGVLVKIAFSALIGLSNYAKYFDWVYAICAGLLFAFILYASDWILNKIMGWPDDHRGKDNPLDKLHILLRVVLILLVWGVVLIKYFIQ